jgi:hypothetical protein
MRRVSVQISGNFCAENFSRCEHSTLVMPGPQRSPVSTYLPSAMSSATQTASRYTSCANVGASLEDKMNNIDIENSVHEVLVGASRLMRPHEVRSATANYFGPGRSLDGWFLCGDASRALVDAVMAAGGAAGVRLTGFCSPNGGNYVTVTHQVGAAQHRFLLPLYDPAVMEYLRAFEHEPVVQVMLGRQGENQAVVLHNGVEWSGIIPLLTMCQTDRDTTPTETIREVRLATAAASRLDTVPSLLGGVPITDVSVSTVLPAEYCLAAIRKYGAPEGFWE